MHILWHGPDGECIERLTSEKETDKWTCFEFKMPPSLATFTLCESLLKLRPSLLTQVGWGEIKRETGIQRGKWR